MTDKELKNLKAKAKKATIGPWEVVEGFAGSFVYNKDGAQVSFNTTMTSSESKHNVSAKQARINSEYIAAVNPVVMFKLITELRQARKERDWLISQLVSITNTNKGAWLEAAKEAIK